jgi:cell division protease FtsH
MVGEGHSAGDGIGRIVLSAGRSTGSRPGEGAVTALLADHLGQGAANLPAVTGSWPAYEHVNIQAGLDHWLAEQGGDHQLVGLVGAKHRLFGLADLLQPGQEQGIVPGSVATVDQPSGPDGALRSCVECALYFATAYDVRTVLMLRGSDQRGSQPDVTVEVVSTDLAASRRILGEIRDLAIRHNVYRGQVVSFGREVMGPMRGALLTFHPRPALERQELILPDGVLEGIERQVLGVARHRARLLAHGQHLKRGILLYGAPGVGKTHTVRYLMSRMPETTVVLLTGTALHLIREACSVADTLAPALVVIEDVDLIAENRDIRPGQNPLLFQILNEMDGLSGDADVTFLLTTNRVDVLEPALASRPGRVDHAVELPLPDAAARRRLLELYRGGLLLDPAHLDRAVERTEGATASFLKELLRRAALLAADEQDGEQAAAADGASDGDSADGTDDVDVVAGAAGSQQPTDSGAAPTVLAAPFVPLNVTGRHLDDALSDLNDTRNLLTRRLLGANSPQQE